MSMIETPNTVGRARLSFLEFSWILCLLALVAGLVSVAPVLRAQDEGETPDAEEVVEETENGDAAEVENGDETSQNAESEGEDGKEAKKDSAEASEDDASEEEEGEEEGDANEEEEEDGEQEGDEEETPKAKAVKTTAPAAKKPAKQRPPVKQPVRSSKTSRAKETEAAKARRDRFKKSQLDKQKRRRVAERNRQATSADRAKASQKPKTTPKKDAPKEEAKDEKSGSFRAWLKENLVMLAVTVWGAALALLAVGLVVMKGRRARPPEVEAHGLEEEEYTASEADTAEIRIDDKSYALVVEEEELEKPPTPEEKRKSAELRRIEKVRHHQEDIERMIDRQSYDAAYEKYEEHIIGESSTSPLEPGAERVLGKHFLGKGELEKAATILEHYVDTQSESDVDPEVLFDLGYIHFKGNTLGKSREYFERFAAKETHPERSQRARELAKRLEKVQNLN